MTARIQVGGLCGLLIAVCAGGGMPATGEKAPPLFVNVAPAVGLAGVAAKDCVFTDLDGDGYLDLVLDRQRFYRSRGGRRFDRQEGNGIAFPVVEQVPLTPDGEPDFDKAKEKPYVPQYLHFADLDNDGDQDAVWGVHSHWEAYHEGAPGTSDTGDASHWEYIEECDPLVRSMIYLNDGAGQFEEGPYSGFTDEDAWGPAMALAIVDVDGDGCLDLYEGREYRLYGVLEGCGVDRLWHGDGEGGFRDVTEAAGLMTGPEAGDSRPSYGVTHADWNNDGWQDLLELSYGRQWNRLWRNEGDGTFTEVGKETTFAGDAITHGRYPGDRRPAEAPFRSNGNTFDCAVGDYDNDGDLDLYLGEIQHAWAGEASDLPSVLINQGAAGGWRFERKTILELLPPRPNRDPANANYADLHVSWFDYDNDTRLDLLVGSGDYPDGQFLRLYHQREDGSFVDVTEQAGFDWEGCGDLSLGDFDRDGDVDILAGRSFMRLGKAHREKYMKGLAINEVGLFRNDVANANGNHWLEVRLQGSGRGGANRDGIGARVSVTAGGLTQIREIRCGSGLSNHQDALMAHFGLGSTARVERITVRWPDKTHTRQQFDDLPADRLVTIIQGKEDPELVSAGMH